MVPASRGCSNQRLIAVAGQQKLDADCQRIQRWLACWSWRRRRRTSRLRESSQRRKKNERGVINVANRNANQETEPVVAAAIMPMLAEINGLNRRILAQAAQLPPEVKNASIAISEKVKEIWGLLLAKDNMAKLEIPDEAVGEIAAVIERYQTEVAAA